MVVSVDPSGRYLYLVDLSIRRVVAELYRGRNQCEVRAVSISHDNMYLSLITDHNKVHIYCLENVLQSKL